MRAGGRGLAARWRERAAGWLRRAARGGAGADRLLLLVARTSRAARRRGGERRAAAARHAPGGPACRWRPPPASWWPSPACPQAQPQQRRRWRARKARPDRTLTRCSGAHPQRRSARDAPQETAPAPRRGARASAAAQRGTSSTAGCAPQQGQPARRRPRGCAGAQQHGCVPPQRAAQTEPPTWAREEAESAGRGRLRGGPDRDLTTRRRSPPPVLVACRCFAAWGRCAACAGRRCWTGWLRAALRAHSPHTRCHRRAPRRRCGVRRCGPRLEARAGSPLWRLRGRACRRHRRPARAASASRRPRSAHLWAAR